MANKESEVVLVQSVPSGSSEVSNNAPESQLQPVGQEVITASPQQDVAISRTDAAQGSSTSAQRDLISLVSSASYFRVRNERDALRNEWDSLDTQLAQYEVDLPFYKAAYESLKAASDLDYKAAYGSLKAASDLDKAKIKSLEDASVLDKEKIKSLKEKKARCKQKAFDSDKSMIEATNGMTESTALYRALYDEVHESDSPEYQFSLARLNANNERLQTSLEKQSKELSIVKAESSNYQTLYKKQKYDNAMRKKDYKEDIEKLEEYQKADGSFRPVAPLPAALQKKFDKIVSVNAERWCLHKEAKLREAEKRRKLKEQKEALYHQSRFPRPRSQSVGAYAWDDAVILRPQDETPADGSSESPNGPPAPSDLTDPSSASSVSPDLPVIPNGSSVSPDLTGTPSSSPVSSTPTVILNGSSDSPVHTGTRTDSSGGSPPPSTSTVPLNGSSDAPVHTGAPANSSVGSSTPPAPAVLTVTPIVCFIETVPTIEVESSETAADIVADGTAIHNVPSAEPYQKLPDTDLTNDAYHGKNKSLVLLIASADVRFLPEDDSILPPTLQTTPPPPGDPNDFHIVGSSKPGGRSRNFFIFLLGFILGLAAFSAFGQQLSDFTQNTVSLVNNYASLPSIFLDVTTNVHDAPSLDNFSPLLNRPNPTTSTFFESVPYTLAPILAEGPFAPIHLEHFDIEMYRSAQRVGIYKALQLQTAALRPPKPTPPPTFNYHIESMIKITDHPCSSVHYVPEDPNASFFTKSRAYIYHQYCRTIITQDPDYFAPQGSGEFDSHWEDLR